MPISPAVGDAISESLVPWICACVRATFQMRDSSMIPAKNPAAVPFVFIAVPSAAHCRLSARGGIGVVVLTTSVPSSTPSR